MVDIPRLYFLVTITHVESVYEAMWDRLQLQQLHLPNASRVVVIQFLSIKWKYEMIWMSVCVCVCLQKHYSKTYDHKISLEMQLETLST